MRRLKKILSVLLTSILFISGCSNNTIKENKEAIVKSLVSDILDEKYEQLEDYSYISALQSEMKKKSMHATLKLSYAAFGEFKQIKEIENPKKNEYDVMVQFEKGDARFKITFIDEKIAGIIFSGEPIERKMPDTILEREISFMIDDSRTLQGTLCEPNDATNQVVIFVHGSGPSDRNETLLNNVPFQDIAWGLAKQGITSYRYDKRTYEYATQTAKDIHFTLEEETIDDVVKAVSLMKEEGYTNIYIIGHSLGGYAIPLINEKCDINGYVMLAAPARALNEMMLEQYEFLFNLDKEISNEESLYLTQVKSQLAKLERIDELDADTAILSAYPTYWKYILDYDPFTYADKITKPVLVLQGEEDYQVTMEDYHLWKQHYDSNALWQFKSYPKLTHLFMEGKKEYGNNAYLLSSYVAGEVIQDIAQFIKAN